MGIIPAHAFGRRPMNELKMWLHFDVIGDRIAVYESSQPVWQESAYSLVGVMAKDRALDHAAGRLKQESSFPLRIDVGRTFEGTRLAEELNSEIMQLVKSRRPRPRCGPRFTRMPRPIRGPRSRS
jgi:hypothetical protein